MRKDAEDMSKKKVSLKTCLLLCVICVLTTVTVFGNTTMKEIVAYLNYTIDIVVDGEVKELKDAQGNRVYPISYNGTTYVPVRGVSTLLGVDVEWDSVNGAVVLTTNAGVEDKADLLEGVEKTSRYSHILSAEEKEITVNKEKLVFQNGIYCSMLENSDVHVKDFLAIPVSEDITEISFKAYSDKKCSINIFNQQGKLLKTFYLQANTVTSFVYPMDTSANKEIHFVALNQSNNVNGGYVKILDIFGE